MIYIHQKAEDGLLANNVNTLVIKCQAFAAINDLDQRLPHSPKPVVPVAIANARPDAMPT